MKTRLGGTVARWALVVTVAFAAIHGPYLYRRYQPNKWLFADGAFYFTTVRALANHGRLEQRDLQPQSWYVDDLGWNRWLTDDWSNVALGRDGTWYPKHPILLPALAVPFYWLFGTPGTLATNVLLNLAFVLLVFLLARRVAHPAVAALTAIAVCATPFCLAESYTFSNDVLGAVLVLGALEGALAGWFGLAGVLAGLSIWSRVTNAALVPALAIVAWSVGGGRAVWRASLFAMMPLGAFGALNTYLFGAPWISSYQRVLVREGGVVKTASHVRLFTVPMRDGLNRIVFGADGAFHSFPLLLPGLAGIVAVALRKRALALALVLFAVLPALAFAKYEWYRPNFLYPVFGASAIGLAAIPGLLWKPVEVPLLARPLPRWLWPALISAVALGSLAFHLTNRPNPMLLSSHLREARVELGDTPCDYWNPQNERWECSHLDPAGWAMTGAMHDRPEPVRGRPVSAIWLHPSPTGRWKRLIFPHLQARAVRLTFALGDLSHPGPVQLEILARGEPPIALALSQPGEQNERTVALGPGPGDALELRVRSDDPLWKHVVVEGTLVR